MFIFTLLAFILIVFGFGFTLFAYFNWFYEAHKINQISNDLDTFANDYVKLNWDDQLLYENVAAFMQTHNATLVIFDESKPVVFSRDVEVISAVPYTDDIYLTTPNPSMVSYVGSTTSINGVLLSISSTKPLNTMDSSADFKIGNLAYSPYEEVSFIRKVTLTDGSIKSMYASASLQSVKEILNLLRTLLPATTLIVLIGSLILAFIYSRLISKPIVMITNHANAMADMNFDHPISIKGKDELSTLANSLNSLSSELKNTLTALNVSNQKLKEEYDKELKLEVSRKAFVANVSHELRSPLGIIKGYAEGICDQIKIDKQQKYAQTILDEVDLMETLIHDMLEISKHDSGAILFNPSRMTLSNLLHKSLYILQSDLTNKSLNVQIDLPYDEVFADEQSIQRVIDNLIENAVKYAPPSSNILIKTQRVNNIHDAKQTIKFSIENECTPFSDEELNRIWERFYKRDLSHHRKEKGTGLGLSIVKSILDGHGFEYGAERTDKGILFYFIVPREPVLMID